MGGLSGGLWGFLWGGSPFWESQLLLVQCGKGRQGGFIPLALEDLPTPRRFHGTRGRGGRAGVVLRSLGLQRSHGGVSLPLLAPENRACSPECSAFVGVGRLAPHFPILQGLFTTQWYILNK